jgi:hypothetical protein
MKPEIANWGRVARYLKIGVDQPDYTFAPCGEKKERKGKKKSGLLNPILENRVR